MEINIDRRVLECPSIEWTRYILFYYFNNQKFVSETSYATNLFFEDLPSVLQSSCGCLTSRSNRKIRALRAIWYRIHSFVCLARDEYNKSSNGEFHESSRRACDTCVYVNERCIVHTRACIQARPTILSPSLRMHKATAPTEISQLR